MSSLFEKNFSLFQKLHPHQAQKLIQFDDPVPVHLSYQNGTFFWQQDSINGNFPSVQRIPEQLWNSEQHIVVLYGIGDSKYLEFLLQNKDIYFVLVYEPSLTLFKELLEKKDITHLLQDHPRVGFILGTNANLFLDELRNFFNEEALRYYFAGYFANLATPGIEKFKNYQKHVLKFAESFKIAVDKFTAEIQNSPAEDAYQGFISTVQNSDHYYKYPDISEFKNMYSDLPGIVVGSGPSLKFSLPYLKKVQDKAVIYSCDSTLKILLEEGIQPHFVGIIERMPWQADLIDNVPQDQTPALIAPTLVHNSAFKSHHGPKIAIRRNIGFAAWLYPEYERHYLGKVVSHLGVTSLSLLGCKDIYLIGIDSAYAPEQSGKALEDLAYTELATEKMKSLAKATQDFLANRSLIFKTLGYDNKPKATQYYWHINLEDFPEIKHLYHIQNLFNVMPVEYGIPLPETTRIDPEDLEKKLSSLASQPIKEKFEKQFSLQKSHDDQFSQIKKIVKETHLFLDEIIAKCTQNSIQISEFFLENHSTIPENIPKYKPFFYEIEKARHEIMTHSSGLFEKLLMPLILSHHALMEHNLRKAHTLFPDQERVVEYQCQCYRDWFHEVMTYALKVKYYLKNQNMLN